MNEPDALVAFETLDKTKTRHRISCLACGREPNDRAMGVEFDVDGCAAWHCLRRGLAGARDDGLAYLNSRGCAIPPHDADLRFDPMARHPSGYLDMNDFLQGANHG